jgi:hypothetical protein
MTEVRRIAFPAMQTPCDVAANVPPHTTLQKGDTGNTLILGQPHLLCPALCAIHDPSAEASWVWG